MVKEIYARFFFLWYILLDHNLNKRYYQGPIKVFTNPYFLATPPSNNLALDSEQWCLIQDNFKIIPSEGEIHLSYKICNFLGTASDFFFHSGSIFLWLNAIFHCLLRQSNLPAVLMEYTFGGSKFSEGRDCLGLMMKQNSHFMGIFCIW